MSPQAPVIEVGNVRNGDLKRPGAVYLGRAVPSRRIAGSPLANPYPVMREHNRDASIAKYRRWLADRIGAGDQAVIAELDALARRACAGPLVLVCWCAPKPCHSEVVRDAVLALLGIDAPQSASADSGDPTTPVAPG